MILRLSGSFCNCVGLHESINPLVQVVTVERYALDADNNLADMWPDDLVEQPL